MINIDMLTKLGGFLADQCKFENNQRKIAKFLSQKSGEAMCVAMEKVEDMGIRREYAALGVGAFGLAYAAYRGVCYWRGYIPKQGQFNKLVVSGIKKTIGKEAAKVVSPFVKSVIAESIEQAISADLAELLKDMDKPSKNVIDTFKKLSADQIMEALTPSIEQKSQEIATAVSGLKDNRQEAVKQAFNLLFNKNGNKITLK